MAVRAVLVAAALVFIGAGAATAGFPGTNGKIVFDRHTELTARQIVSMNADGTDQVGLTTDAAGGYFASGSPDGRRIAFTRCAADCEIYVMNVDGSGEKNLTDNPATDVRPAWSPDGKKIAFGSRGRTGDWEIFVMNADGSDPRNLSNNPALDWEPAWSPDGTKIAFTRITEGGPSVFEVVVMNADGSGQTSLTPPPGNGSTPDWSPDGTKIVYRSGVPFPPGSNLQGSQSDIFVMNADGSGKTDLTNSTPIEESDPVWSPDGTKIAYAAVPTQISADTDIFVMNADGSGQTNLTNSSALEAGPDWLPVPAVQPPPPPAAPSCRVPRVVGLRLAPAKQRIRQANCAVGRIRKKHSKHVGRVLAQSPRAGTKLPLRGRVNLVVGRRA